MNSKKITPFFIMLGVLLPLLACESSRACPPSEPTFELKEVPKPYAVVLKFAPLPPLVLPEYPAQPGHDADEEEWKAWSQEVKRISAERETMKDARIEALEERERTLGLLEETYEIPDPD